MNKRAAIFLTSCLAAVLGVLAWQLLRPNEPAYKGKRLSQWLDEYNRVGSLDKTEPISEAIRAIGTNSLPFLLAHVRHTDSPAKQKFFYLVGKYQFFKLPFYGADPYRSTSILALHALGPEAGPAFPELLRISENPRTSWWGLMSLLAVGTNSIPTLEKACQSTNTQVRTQAVLMMAMMKAMGPPWFSWGWNKAPINGRPMFTLGYAVGEDEVREMINMLEHPNAAVRRASAEAIGLYTVPPYTRVAKSAVPLLTVALKDVDPDVRQSAGETLKKIDPQVAAKAGLK